MLYEYTKLGTMANYAPFYSITFGKDKNKNLSVGFNPDQWQKVPSTSLGAFLPLIPLNVVFWAP